MSDKNRRAAAARWALTYSARVRAKALREDLRILAGVIRHEATRIRNRESNRARSLLAYHESGYKRHLRAGLLSAARRMFTTKAHQSLSSLLRAGRRVVERHSRLNNRRARAKLVRCLRRRLEGSMFKLKSGVSKSKTARALVGCDLNLLRQHLEKQFKPGMTWENHGYHGWHVDHIIPLAAFDLNVPEQAAQAFHYINLQPLWAAENLKKRNHLPESFRL